MFYTGIGARKTPKEILDLFVRIGKYLANEGFVLRSGGAKGTDHAFEKGCDLSNGKKEIYLPWKGFEGSNSHLIVKDRKAFDIAKIFHPYWDSLKQGAKKLQARNSHQILGNDLNSPSKFVICWTEKGLGRGGTGQALRIAKHYKIPIFDAGEYDSLQMTRQLAWEFLRAKIGEGAQ